MTKIATVHHPQAHKRPPASKLPRPKRSGHGGLVTLAVIAALVVGAGLWWLARPAGDTADPTETLLEQMHQAASGTVNPTHAFGGTLSVTRGNGRMNVVAENVPAKACVQAGWRLAKEGTVIVNGILSMRLSAAKLAEMCEGEGGATLTWAPDETR